MRVRRGVDNADDGTSDRCTEAAEVLVRALPHQCDAGEPCNLIPIIADGLHFNVVFRMSSRLIYQSNELLPGGWW